MTFNSNNQLALTNKAARHMFNLTQRDIGSKFSNLDLAYRPVDLRSPYEQARTGRRPAILKEVEWTFPNNSTRYLDIQIAPLFEKNSILIGISITFHDVTTHKKLQQQVEHVNQGLETAMEELQSANEELETTNEELQSTNEELETTNEELQSTNEELETMNEELQSTNQELETVNEELHQRNQAFNLVNAYLESILSSMYGGVVVLNRDMRVQVWNHQSENLWGLRDDEVVNQLFFNLDIGLPVEQLTKLIRECLEGETHRGEITLEARNRRGNIFPCRVTCVPLVDLRKKTQGVIMIMEASDGSGRKRGDGSGKSTG